MYFIAIVLPKDLDAEIIKYKQLMLERWGCTVGLKSPAHITVVPPFWMSNELETTLLKDADAVSKLFSPFIITTNNFSAFKPRTIFIDVLLDDKVTFVKKQTESYFTANKSYKIKRENRPFHPHITIATRDLHKKAFAEAWLLFEHKTYRAAFEVQGLATLRHNKKTWDIIHTSRLG